MSEDLPITRRVVVPARDLQWSATRASGPGGQNVNKVATKVDLRFDLDASTALATEVKERLRLRHGNRIDGQGRLQIVVGSTRSQQANLEAARAKLVEWIRAAMTVPRRRRPTKPSKAAKARRVDAKRKLSEKKARRRHTPEA